MTDAPAPLDPRQIAREMRALLAWLLRNNKGFQAMPLAASLARIRAGRNRIRRDGQGFEQQPGLISFYALPETIANLKAPSEDRDLYLLVRIPRSAVVEFSSPIERPRIIVPGQGGN